ncbi:hypothetical protein J2Z21_000095 [Streptomyces griseochromogenes]|uniref:Uncharacterized protein n=1 Tax=Streptomyces griseochromogenes TaxID=68214 RepID=A0A1B1B193_9ACTN|nr:hypothetical protein [Streptomyces griseochromogenes]ANP52596.1 hypothetical protein AVL59_26385 [Streptomyces griseochromogenes]MBP2047173.1 hypothetical protein [Streptomyces griseochromogenes]
MTTAGRDGGPHAFAVAVAERTVDEDSVRGAAVGLAVARAAPADVTPGTVKARTEARVPALRGTADPLG